jgi:hypothetical protein
MRLPNRLKHLGTIIVVGVVASACVSTRPAEPPPTQAVEAVLPTPLATDPPPTLSPPTPAATPTAQARVDPTAAPPTATLPAATAIVATVAATPRITVPTASPTGSQAQVRSPDVASEVTRIAAQFESALNRGDVEAALAMFDDQAEVKIPPDVYNGETQIRGWLEYLAANHFAAEPGFRNTTGDRGMWPLAVRSDYLSRLGLPSLDGTATLMVHNGRIASYTFVLSRDSAARHRAAQLAASQVLQDPVIVGLSSANVYGFNDVFRDSSGRLISYRDVLTSEPGSGPFFDLGGEPIIVRSGF